MGMLDRYKKKGGFIQLLSLMETCGPQKQEKFFEMIDLEDPNWSMAVRSKMISIQRVFSWDQNTIAEIVGTLNDLTVAVATLGLDDVSKEKVNKCLDHSRQRKIQFILSEKKPNQAEIQSTFLQIITEVRKMIQEGYIRLDKVDPALYIDSTYEEKLVSGLIFFDNPKEKKEVKPATVSAAPAEKANTNELDSLRRRVAQLTEENQKLKDKLTGAEEKLTQIRKIA